MHFSGMSVSPWLRWVPVLMLAGLAGASAKEHAISSGGLGPISCVWSIPDSEVWTEVPVPKENGVLMPGASVADIKMMTDQAMHAIMIIAGTSPKFLLDDIEDPEAVTKLLDGFKQGMAQSGAGQVSIRQTGFRRLSLDGLNGAEVLVVFSNPQARVELPAVIRVYFAGYKWAMVFGIHAAEDADPEGHQALIDIMNRVKVEKATNPLFPLGILAAIFAAIVIWRKKAANRPVATGGQERSSPTGLTMEEWRRQNR